MSAPGQLQQLTGIRAVAFLMVFFSHAGFPGFFLWSGVDLFFVLSGFLITGILLSQDRRTGYFRVFYARRFLRIFPPFYVILLLSILVLRDVSKWQVTSIALFYTNLYMPLADSTSVSPSYWALSPYWSLALEEQFYLLWPLLVFTLSPKQVLKACLVLVAVAPLLRGLTYLYLFLPQHASYEAIRLLPWNRLDLLAAGGAIATCRHLNLFKPETMARCGLLLCGTSAAIIVLGVFLSPDFRYTGHSLLFSTLGLTAICGLMAGIIMYLAYAAGGPIIKILSYAPVVYLGTISYTMYLLHGTVLVVLQQNFGMQSGWLFMACAFTVILLLAALSWHWLELPAKRLKDSPWFMRKVRLQPQIAKS